MWKSRLLPRRIASVLLLVSFVSSNEGFTQDRPARIVIDSVKVPSKESGLIDRYGVTRDDFDSIQTQVPGIKWSVPIRRIVSEVRYGSREGYADLLGTTETYAKMLDPKRIKGRFLLAKDIRQLNNVAIIGSKLAQQLFDDRDPIGLNVRVGPDYYLIVGIVEAEARRDEFEGEPVPIRTETKINFDDTETTTEHFVPVEVPEESLFVPISTMQARNGDNSIVRTAGSFEATSFQFSRIELVLENSRHKLETARLIERILKEHHPQDDYRIQLPR